MNPSKDAKKKTLEKKLPSLTYGIHVMLLD
jgi:hypothetical protein